MSLSIQERLKDLRVERGLTLGQLAEQTGLSKSALGSYETEDFKDISHYALIRLAKFYGVTADYLLGLSEMKNHPNADLADLRLSDEMIDLLKSGRIDNTLLCELAAHPDFPRLMEMCIRDRLGVEKWFVICGIGIIIVALAVFLLPGLREIDNTQ